MQEDARPGIAVIGLGRMGQIYARTISEMGEAELFAVASEDLPTQASLISQLNVTRTFTDASHVFELDEVDAVVIATPTSTHCALVLKAVDAGKAIFCEKPLALTLEDTHQILDAVRDARIPLQVGFMRRFDREFAEAKAAIDAGRIGEPVTFKAIGRDPACPPPGYADPAHSGGLIIDMGIHDFDLARWYMGSEVVRVTAEASTLVCENLKDVGDYDNAVVNLRFASGSIGNVEVSRNAFYGYDIRAEVLGSKAAVRVGLDKHGTQLIAEPRPNADPKVDYLTDRFGDAYERQIRHFVASVRRGHSPWPTGRDALAAFEIGLAATYAAQTGEPVELDDVRSGWIPSTTTA